MSLLYIYIILHKQKSIAQSKKNAKYFIEQQNNIYMYYEAEGTQSVGYPLGHCPNASL